VQNVRKSWFKIPRLNGPRLNKKTDEFNWINIALHYCAPVKQKKVHGFTPVKQKKILVSQGKLDKNFTGQAGIRN